MVKKGTFFDNLNESYLDIAKVEKLMKDAFYILDKYPIYGTLKDLKYNDLSDLLGKLDFLSISIRKALSEIDTSNLVIYDAENKMKDRQRFDVLTMEDALKRVEEIRSEAINKFPTDCKYNEGVFEFYTPLTFKRGFVKSHLAINYNIAIWLEKTINEWTKKNNFILENRIKGPYIIIMKRVEKKYSIAKSCDADNIENQKVINTIVRAFGLSDKANLMSLYSTFEENPYKKSGMYFYIFSEKDIEKHLNLFKKNNSKNNTFDRIGKMSQPNKPNLSN